MEAKTGSAALAALEALLLLLLEKGVFSLEEISEALGDAAAALGESCSHSASHVLQIETSIRSTAHSADLGSDRP